MSSPCTNMFPPKPRQDAHSLAETSERVVTVTDGDTSIGTRRVTSVLRYSLCRKYIHLVFSQVPLNHNTKVHIVGCNALRSRKPHWGVAEKSGEGHRLFAVEISRVCCRMVAP
ncbi:hypothetical protein LXA43DRAFT_596263 [Ganoderma leucocontextum]|nr:hypothetical protein LXA43DRAFT_596263 [Ganoderma leucocontextum]